MDGPPSMRADRCLAQKASRPSSQPPGLAQAADRAVSDIVKTGDVRQRLEAFVAPGKRLAALVRRQLGRATEQRATALARLRPSLVR